MTVRIRNLLLVLFACFALSSCAGFMGPRNLELPLSTLQASLEKRFPFGNRVLEIFDVNISNPRLALQPGSSRIVTTLDASVAPSFLKNSWRGSLAVSGMLALDHQRGAVVLADPRVENMRIDGVDPAYARQVNRIGALLIEQAFRDISLYKFNPHDFRYAGTSFLPTKINTTPNSLVVTFEPVR